MQLNKTSSLQSRVKSESDLVHDALERGEHGGVDLALQLHDLGAAPHGQRGLDGARLARRAARRLARLRPALDDSPYFTIHEALTYTR